MVSPALVVVVAVCMTLLSFLTQPPRQEMETRKITEAVACEVCADKADATAQAATPTPAAPQALPAHAEPAPVAEPPPPLADNAPKVFEDTPPAMPPSMAAAPTPAPALMPKPAPALPAKKMRGKPASPHMEAASALAPAPAPADSLASGFHINVGLFAVPTNAHNAYQKLKVAGFNVYTQELNTKRLGHATRVRVGPFASRAEAEAAAQQIHTLQLEAVVFQR